MKHNFIICHYAEIGLKGGNRKFFEEKLIENIKTSFIFNSCDGVGKIKRISGRILIEIDDKAKEDKIRQALENVIGIAYFSFAVNCEQNIEEIKKKSFEILENKEFKTFRVETKRGEKDFPLTSQQINEQVGEYIFEKLNAQGLKIRVNLKNPDITCFIEVVEKYVFLFLEKVKGLGGLPVGTSGKAISLLSGGIDSPVASFYGIRRGVQMIFLHFYTNQKFLEKVRKNIRTLNKYQFKSELYLIPFLDIHKAIFHKTNPELGCILCRRFMFRIAEVLAGKKGADVLFTGENIGQVASQTLANMRVIEQAINIPVLKPLIGMDKKDIIEKAEQIGTFETSILPEEFYCQKFLAKHPETKANLKRVLIEEEKIEVQKLIQEAIKKLKVEEI